MTIIKYLFITLTLLVMNAYLLHSGVCDNNDANLCLHTSLQQDIESILFAKADNFSLKNEDDILIALEQLELSEGHDDNSTMILKHVTTTQITNITNISSKSDRDKSVNIDIKKKKHVDRVKMLDNNKKNSASKTSNYNNVPEEGKYCSC